MKLIKTCPATRLITLALLLAASCISTSHVQSVSGKCTEGAQGFYKTDEISTRYNAKKDCSGDMVDEIGLDIVKFIQLNPAKDRMIICKTPSLQACYGPLKRLP